MNLKKSLNGFTGLLVTCLILLILAGCGANSGKSENGGYSGVVGGGGGDSTLSDADAAAADKNALEIGLGGVDADINNVTTGLTLLTTGDEGSTITWSSPNIVVVSHGGKVARSASDTTVILTATITKGTITLTKTFSVKVLATPSSANDAITADYNSLVDETILRANTALISVTGNLTLPTAGASGTTITWSEVTDTTSNILISGATGNITRPASASSDATVTIRATITKSGGTTLTKDFTIKVLATPSLADAAISDDAASLVDEAILGTNPALYCVTANLALPTSGASGTVIAWSSDNAAVNAANGTVTRPANNLSDVTVNLIATISKSGGTTITKTFTVLVLKMPPTHTVTFDSNKGTTIGTLTGSMGGQIIGEGLAANLTNKTFTNTGYTFAGWNTSADGTGTTYANMASYTMGTANVTLYAKWTATVYNITYNNMAGAINNPGNPATYTIESSTITLQNPTKGSSTFYGWYTAAEFLTQVTVIPSGSTGNQTVYAQWPGPLLRAMVNSSSYDTVGGRYDTNVKDGTRWSMEDYWQVAGSSGSCSGWIYVGLSRQQYVAYIKLYWKDSAQTFSIEGSNDASTWTTILSGLTTTNGSTTTHTINGTWKYIRMSGDKSNGSMGFSLYEFEVYN